MDLDSPLFVVGAIALAILAGLQIGANVNEKDNEAMLEMVKAGASLEAAYCAVKAAAANPQCLARIAKQ